MATYAIGDVQGCFRELMALLEKIAFDPYKDQLWLTGDLINRGPASLPTLRYLMRLPQAPIIVLGNHDLHLLAVAAGAVPKHPKDTCDDILMAPDRDELLAWLRLQPLLHHDARLNYTMVHAGLYPAWTLKAAKKYAQELEVVLRGPHHLEFFEHMYGNEPTHWSEDLTGYDRLRFIANAFTRMRFCTADGGLNLTNKGTVDGATADLIPWFKMPRAEINLRVVFGHWAALGGVAEENFYHLDTGCVWGQQLTALRLEDQQLFQVPGYQAKR